MQHCHHGYLPVIKDGVEISADDYLRSTGLLRAHEGAREQYREGKGYQMIYAWKHGGFLLQSIMRRNDLKSITDQTAFFGFQPRFPKLLKNLKVAGWAIRRGRKYEGNVCFFGWELGRRPHICQQKANVGHARVSSPLCTRPQVRMSAKDVRAT